MNGTLTPTCPLCGLRYQSSPLLELHIREDHNQQPGHRDPGRTRATPADADSPAHTDGPPPRPSRTTREVTAMRAPLHLSARRVKTGLRRAVRAVQHVNDELLRAGEAIIRPARAPQARPRVKAAANGHARPGTRR